MIPARKRVWDTSHKCFYLYMYMHCGCFTLQADLWSVAWLFWWVSKRKSTAALRWLISLCLQWLQWAEKKSQCIVKHQALLISFRRFSKCLLSVRLVKVVWPAADMTATSVRPWMQVNGMTLLNHTAQQNIEVSATSQSSPGERHEVKLPTLCHFCWATPIKSVERPTLNQAFRQDVLKKADVNTE